MDFDKILRQWDDIQKQEAKKKKSPSGRGKKPNAPHAGEESAGNRVPPLSAKSPSEAGRRESERASDYLNHWITMHGVPDKDEDSEAGEADDRRSRMVEADRIKRMRPQAVLDLHGKTAAEAEALIVDFLLSGSRSGLEKVLIIHGKGLHSSAEHVMTDIVRRALETNGLAGSFGPADRNQGGRGASWVRIRKRDYFSR